MKSLIIIIINESCLGVDSSASIRRNGLLLAGSAGGRRGFLVGVEAHSLR